MSGKFQFHELPSGKTYLITRLPTGEEMTLHVVVDKGRGGRVPDEKYTGGYRYWWSWDGDREKPSLRNSILGMTWHGFLDKGEFVDKVKDEGDWW